MNNKQPKYYKLNKATISDLQCEAFYKVIDNKVFYLAKDYRGNKNWVLLYSDWNTIYKAHHSKITELSYQDMFIELL